MLELQRTDADRVPVGVEPRARGGLVGRYVILSLLGSGGMGTVYAAYDPELDRKVALKLLRSDAATEHATRLVREARALAKLAHPNVVAVYDVGAVEAEVFIAMEFIEGRTVTQWLRERERSVREVLDVFLAAGRGLAAAHQADLVHRDFKPDNTMIGNDGRVRVMDFGLARAGGRATTVPDISANESATRSDDRLTREGSLIGTPAYMAPEQWSNGRIDAATDQFAFCVALWEALYGQRPFRGGSIYALMASVTNGKIDTPKPGGARVPTGIRRVLERGLAIDRTRRYPTMDALLAAIDRAQVRRNRGFALLGLGAVGLVATVIYGARAQREADCEAAGQRIAEIWNDDARSALRTALFATDVSYAASTYDKVVPALDRWTAGWSAMSAGVCREANVDGTRTPALYERSQACLDERYDALAGLLDVLRDSKALDVQLVLPAVANLEDVEPCSERAFLERRPELPTAPGAREQVEALRRDLMRTHGLLAAGLYAQGLGQAEALLASAESLGYRPLAVEARALVGLLTAHAETGDHGEVALRQVFLDASEMGADDLAARAAIQLVSTVGVGRGRPAEGLLWSLPATALVRRLGQQHSLPGASLFNNLALVHGVQSEFDEALQYNEQALTIREDVLGPFHPEVAATLTNMAVVQRARGSYAAAAASYERALAIGEAALGPDHPSVATTLNNLGLLSLTRGLYEDAQSSLERALAIRRAAYGEQHAETATTLNNLGFLHYTRGRYAAAEELLAAALAIRESVLGREHRDVATTLSNLGLVHLVRGEFAEARSRFDRAFEIRERALHAGHPSMANIYNNLGMWNLARGDLAEARALLEKALTIRRQKFGPNHLDVALSLHSLAIVHSTRGDLATAVAYAQDALDIAERALGKEHPEVATFLNTHAFAQLPVDLDAAERHARRALEISQPIKGPSHPTTATAQHLLGRVFLARGSVPEAHAWLTAALAAWEGVGPRVPEVADVLIDLAALERLRGTPVDALRLAERALEIRELQPLHGCKRSEALLLAARIAAEAARVSSQFANRSRDLERRVAADDASVCASGLAAVLRPSEANRRANGPSRFASH